VPHAHLVRYGGCLAPHSKLRAAIICYQLTTSWGDGIDVATWNALNQAYYSRSAETFSRRRTTIIHGLDDWGSTANYIRAIIWVLELDSVLAWNIS